MVVSGAAVLVVALVAGDAVPPATVPVSTDGAARADEAAPRVPVVVVTAGSVEGACNDLGGAAEVVVAVPVRALVWTRSGPPLSP